MNFFDKMLNEFPILEEDFADTEDWEIHYRMERIAAFIKNCIKAKSVSEVDQCFNIFERYLELGIDSKLINAMNVSFCEPLLLINTENDTQWFYSKLKPKLKRIYDEYETYYYELYKKSKQMDKDKLN